MTFGCKGKSFPKQNPGTHEPGGFALLRHRDHGCHESHCDAQAGSHGGASRRNVRLMARIAPAKQQQKRCCMQLHIGQLLQVLLLLCLSVATLAIDPEGEYQAQAVTHVPMARTVSTLLYVPAFALVMQRKN